MIVKKKKPKINRPKGPSFEFLREVEWTEKQKRFIDLCLHKDTKMIFLDAPAGVGKSLISIFCGLKLVQDGRSRRFVYVRTAIESAYKGIGFLPGEFDDKLGPYKTPLRDKLDELLNKTTSDKLLKDYIEFTHVGYLRGSSFNNTFLLFDEAQNAIDKEIITTITRMGKYSKFIICGDQMQSDINGKSGFRKIFNLFDNKESQENGIFTFKFDKSDVMRSEQCKFILEKLEEYKGLN